MKKRAGAWAIALFGAVGLACCGGGDDDTAAQVDGGDNHIDGGGGAVPDPGNGALVTDWLDTEPNDTQATAVPLGTATADVYTWMGFVADPPSQIGGSDTADFYVFRSGPAASIFHSQVCWSSGTNLIDFKLSKVVGGQPVSPPLASFTSADTACENPPADTPLEPNTVYLVELDAVAGEGPYSS
jgi:hypothetical protein